MVVMMNLYFAWGWILAGMIFGAGLGLYFHRHDWLGGFDAWPRRMVRLAHISFLGTGLLNVAYAFTTTQLSWSEFHPALERIASILFIVGAVTMPTVCLAAAWRKPFRHLFFIPASSLIISAAAICLLLGLCT